MPLIQQHDLESALQLTDQLKQRLFGEAIIQNECPSLWSSILHIESQMKLLAGLHEFAMNRGFSVYEEGYFGSLPQEIKLHIFSFLIAESVGRCGRVCREWRRLTEEELLWQSLVGRDFPSAFRCKPVHKTWKWLYQSHYVAFAPKQTPGSFISKPGGDRYYGDWKGDQKHGYGIFIWSDQKKEYHGEWKCDKREGYGRYMYKDGTHYEGQWKEDKRNGTGTYSWPDGRQYCGQWKDHRKNGRGAHIWPDGSRYVGQWKDGSRDGEGMFHWEDGRCYKGNWSKGKMKGRGTFYWADGDRYVGEWDVGRRFGKGVFITKDGQSFEQDWSEEGKFDRTNKGCRKRRLQPEDDDDLGFKRQKLE
eukprot:TRINITY_DN12392_c0_g1_i1.p1 TRINITY_DN12392_c0_g1~~TRINITY_DN12392_c0_g1_i1.p1  ORF type:complete len:361 (-),score=50.07 TRINITY_DN12392_c0_g1_i1:19-1101(-)